jgi:hypothetical protein
MKKCETIGCQAFVIEGQILCDKCTQKLVCTPQVPFKEFKAKVPELSTVSLAAKYPKYYKSTQGMTEVDVYAVLKIFDIQDPSGALHHATKKLLLSGVRTGGKTKQQDITEARDTLNRWLELNKE